MLSIHYRKITDFTLKQIIKGLHINLWDIKKFPTKFLITICYIP